jgi:hypothetical protein
MGGFSKSKKVIQRAWEKFKDSFRWNTGNLRVYEFHPVIDSAIKEKNYEIQGETVDYPLEFSDVEIRDDNLQDTEVKEEIIELEPVITAETPPEQIEAEVKEESLDNIDALITAQEMGIMETEARGLNASFNNAASIKGLKVSALAAVIKQLSFRQVDSAIRNGEEILAQVPIRRNSLSIFKMSAPARMAYWKEIVEQTGKKPAELDLLGIFSHVPTRGITKASIDQTTGSLKLWYSPDQKKNKAATLLIARDRNSKEIIRVFDRRTLS